MKQVLKRYSIILVAVTLLSGLAGWLVFASLLDLSSLVAQIEVLTAIFFWMTLISGILLIRSWEKRPAVLIRTYMGVTGLRMFLYLIIVSILSLANGDQIVEVIIYFFSLYVIYNVVEKVYLINTLKKSENAPENS